MVSEVEQLKSPRTDIRRFSACSMKRNYKLGKYVDDSFEADVGEVYTSALDLPLQRFVSSKKSIFRFPFNVALTST